ncbi:hypothetical protein BRARA_B00598 [Brassica rapa]|uniref:Pentacotripeptide-repeat region of PRORP domain-containing protein n=1 Tax=Brassica campestris TaxID=3711 RepID=A0A398A7M0_BRACM|nr:hypothetical protein BRARA_B00598 [Brassica rapa]
MLNLLSSRYSTRLKASLLSRRHSFASSSSTTSPASSSPRKYVSSSLSGGILDRYSLSLGGSAKASSSPLKGLLLDLSDAVPDITRRFRRFHGLKPEQVLELLLGFESELQRCGKVRPLWNIFRWASKQHKGFKHHSQVYEIMASLLIREGMVKEAELLLLEMEKDGETLDNEVVFCDLIQKYVDGFDSRKAVMLFDWMRGKGLVPLSSCYETLIDHLVRVCKTESAYRVCLDWVEARDESYNMNKIGKVIELLCLDHRVQEARDLARKLSNQTSSIYSRICLGYNEKQDFEDLLSFIREVKYKPDVFVGNRIVHSLCRKFGSERAYVYTEELQRLGFKPDEATYGILIGWCCHEGDLKRAFLYLSEIASKGLKPDVYSYNAVLSGLFRKGLWEHTGCVLEEMKENGVLLGLSTVKVMVAGYCKARRFEEAKKIVKEASKVEDPLTKVGFDPLAVRLKRDNGSGLSKAEFFDELGNGLYLDTDLDAYEEKVNMVLDRSVLPEFNLLIVGACEDGDLHRALSLLDEMPRWGQKLSRRGFTVLMKSLCVSRSYVRVSVSLMRKWPKLANQLDGETLNFLVQEYCKKGLSRQSKLIFHRMSHQTHLHIDNATYTSLISCFCKKESLKDLLNVLDAAKKANWLPHLETCGALWECLLQKGLVNEAVKLFERVFTSKSEACRSFMEKLTALGFSLMAYSIVERLEGEGHVVEEEVYNHLIKGLCKDRNDSAASAVLDKMLQKAFTSDALIEGLCLAGKMSDAENQLRTRLSNGVSLDNDTYSLMFGGYCKGNNLRRVEEVLGIIVRKNVICSVTSYREYVRRMCSERKFISLLLGESNPDGVIIYNLLIFYLFRDKNHKEVEKVLLEMQGRGFLPDEATLNFLVYGYYSCGDYLNSLRYLSAMISEGMRPNKRSLRVVISSLCESGDVKKAMELWEVMESKGWSFGSSVVQTKIAESLISRGDMAKAEDFLTCVTRNGLMAPYYDNVIKKLTGLGSLSVAVHLLNIMLKNRKIPDSSSYDSVINGLLRCSSNKLDEARDFHAEMLELGLSPSVSTWSGLVHKYIEACQVMEAERLIKSMVELGGTPSQEMFKVVIDRFRVENNTVKASEMVEMMQKCGYEVDFETHWSLISNMSSCKEKKTEAGQGFLSRLLSGNGFSWKR